jgi:adenosylhomocysteine nucleosidase
VVRPGFVVGMAAEARIAARFGFPVVAGGGTPEGAEVAARRLVAQGVDALVSFGLAGGLDPALRPGAVLIPTTVLCDGFPFGADAGLAARFGGLTGHCLLGGTVIAADVATKHRLRAETRADAVDLESGRVAGVAVACGLPFVVVRAICDPAERDLPPAALLALDEAGGIGLMRVLWSLLRRPSQLPALLVLASDAARARRALIALAKPRPGDRGGSGAGDPDVRPSMRRPSQQ